MFQGYKTKLGALGSALTGILMIINALTSDTINTQTIMEGVGMVTLALAAFGIGSKIDRQ